MNLNLDDNKIIELRNKGMIYQQIGNELGCSKTTISNHLNNNIKSQSNTKKDTHKKNIKIEDIISLHNQGLTDKEIANKLNCSRSNITNRLNKAGYKNRKSKIENIPLRNKISNSLKGKMIGNKNPNYKGSSEEITLARGLFKTISKEMIRNSGYKCAICGKKSRIYHVHHIKPFSLIVRTFIKTAYSGNIDTFSEELLKYPDFQDRTNLIVICPDCHYKIHYTDNPELSPYRWESATTIESIDEKPIFTEEASRVELSSSKCKDS